MNKIITENGFTFEDENIKGGDIQKFESMTGSELKFDSFDATLKGDLTEAFLITADDKEFYTADDEAFAVGMGSLEYGEILRYYHDDQLQGKFYVENYRRIGQEVYKVSAISAVGLLANSQHYGGIYQGTPFATIAAEIIGGQIPFTVDLTIADQPVYGWLPIATRRENLHQLLFAMNASIKKDENGDTFITALSTDTAKNIPDSRIFNGGSLDFPQANKAIALSEHAFIAKNTDETVTLYNAEIPADSITTPGGSVVLGGLVLFQEPCHDLEITGATILESGVNYAVLSPTAECTLTGKKYTHTVRQVTRPEVLAETTDENKVTVKNATLISVANSEGVADRLARYYGSAKKVTIDIVQGEENTGDCVNFNDPWDQETEGLISAIDSKISGILRSTVEVIADYTPPDIGNYYDAVAMITGTATWNIPAGNDKVRVVLIGGGQAGYKGEDGTDGETSDHFGPENPLGGKGGAGGLAGKGGKILIKTIDTSELASLSISCGMGNTQGNGGEGTATTITAGGTTYTSADGTTSSIGFIETFSGNAYGYAGTDGVQAGDGGGFDNWPNNMDGHDCLTWSGGAHGQRATYTNSSHEWVCNGGCGGGAAYGSNGGAGGDGVANYNTKYAGDGGAGANGANGANGVAYGCGGGGGHGGGGGGAGGVYARDRVVGPGGAIGPGGTGGLGGNGAAGVVFIYYND